MGNILGKVKGWLLGEGENSERRDSRTSIGITRQELLNAIHEHFQQRIFEASTDESLLFATSFVIYLNEQDYQEQEQMFGRTVQDAVNKFNRTIKEEMKRYSDYVPHAQFWQFQFAPFITGSLIDGMDDALPTLDRKQTAIISQIYPTLSDGELSGPADGERIVATVHTKDSMTNIGLAINREAMRGVDMLAKDRFRVSFNDFRKLDHVARSESAEDTARATIKVSQSYFTDGTTRRSSIYMTNDHLIISGRGGQGASGGMQVARLDSDEVLYRHVTLRWDSATKSMWLTAKGEVILNEVPVEPGSIEQAVPNNSTILINGEIQLTVIINRK